MAVAANGDIFVTDGHGTNNRVVEFDRDGSFITTWGQTGADGTFVVAWTQCGRPSGMFIDEDDRLYVTDSTSNSRNNPGWKRGIYIGSAKDGVVTAFIPDPDLPEQEQNRISGASGITADRQGSVYAADVGPHRVRKYVTP